uniref:Uncharacterized protein n=1 Tax=Nelumbo nucifera TaxID=4432 RepID=A0A822Y1N3_NELNU|nr:TPA_asm: hypothetical protein HUJ06_027835 [Nelumbo nucifera]
MKSSVVTLLFLFIRLLFSSSFCKEKLLTFSFQSFFVLRCRL